MSVFVFFLLIKNADDVRQNILNRLSLCVNTLLPSVFPMLVASSFLSQFGLPKPLRSLWGATAGKLCGIPKNGAAAAVFGMVAGYPAGVKSTAILFKQKQISATEAIRLCVSCVHPGISFAVLAVGRGFFRSEAMGWIFYASVLLADLIIAKLSSILLSAEPAENSSGNKTKETSLSQALISAVDTGIGSMTEITAWVLLFSVPETFLKMRYPFLYPAFSPVAEVTAAALAAAEKGTPALCAFSLGFGGFCVHLQLSKDLRAMGVKPAVFLFIRACAGGLSALFTFIGLRLFPQILPTVSRRQTEITFFRTDLVGFLSLCAVCLLFIAETADLDVRPIFRYKKQRKA